MPLWGVGLHYADSGHDANKAAVFIHLLNIYHSLSMGIIINIEFKFEGIALYTLLPIFCIPRYAGFL